MNTISSSFPLLCNLSCFYFVENPSMPNLAGSTGNSGASTEEAVPALSWPPETFEASGDEDSLMGLTNNG